MKTKKICVGILSFLLLSIFLPVFYHMIMFGSNMNYNEAHKIVTVEGNKVLLLCVMIAGMVLILLYALLRRIPYNKFSVGVVIIVTVIICAFFYGVSVNISKCIAFYGGWDCGMVANSARWIYEGGELGYDDYYTIYSNNIPVTWLLYQLYQYSVELVGYPYNAEFIWIQYQCFMFTAALFFMVMTVLRVCKSVAPAILTLIVGSIFLGLSPWKIVPYTDGCTIAIPVCLMFLYTIFRQIKTGWRYVMWFGLSFIGIMGGIMKATTYVSLIAIALVELFWQLSEREKLWVKLKKVLLLLVLLGMAFGIGAYCKKGMYRTLNYGYNYDMEIGWTNYMYNGLNEETTGACSPEGLSIVRAYAGQTREVRTAFEIESIKERIRNKGIKGLMDFWLRKQVMNYNDGTFSWYQEGYFDAWEYENISDSKWKEPLREFYWQGGENYIWFTTWSQGIWIFVLVGIIVEAVVLLTNSLSNLVQKKRYTDWEAVCIRTVGIVTFIGMFLFVMLFEGRARYLYNSIPIFATVAMFGFCYGMELCCESIGIVIKRILDRKYK